MFCGVLNLLPQQRIDSRLITHSDTSTRYTIVSFRPSKPVKSLIQRIQLVLSNFHMRFPFITALIAGAALGMLFALYFLGNSLSNTKQPKSAPTQFDS